MHPRCWLLLSVLVGALSSATARAHYLFIHIGPAAEAGSRSAAPSAEQSFKRITAALEKCNSTLTPAVLEEFKDLPGSLQQRFLKAVKDLASKADGLE